jgi:uncharacterized 2Fe-2S/4Fe-4S cluster protein (DUF4445 family)
MNADGHQLKLSPAGLEMFVPPGARLQDALFAHGVEFPCGGRGRCRGCRVKVLKGKLGICDEEKNLFTRAELAAGWRLACRHCVTGDLELELAQWEMSILTDQSAFAFTPREGLGIAIDLGTTTLAAQLLDLRTGNVLAVATALNAQARHGGDIMSRVDYAFSGGQKELERLIREQLGGMIAQLLAAGAAQPQTPGSPSAIPQSQSAIGNRQSAIPSLSHVVIVGNTVMHHLFCGVNIAPLAAYPFRPEQPGRVRFPPAELGWNLPAAVLIEFLPCLGGFVGSDVLAGILATGLHESAEPVALLDLGTNGEVVVGNRERMFCTSTAAGPAFECARISQGMRASTGAISEVRDLHGMLTCRVIGGGEPRGLCGSGLVDAVAAGLKLGWIRSNGSMAVTPAMKLAGDVFLQPADVRELQLAKGAISAGLRMLAARFGTTLEQLHRIYLAGAFGNYISRTSAQRIGLLRIPLDRVLAAGNTALLGAKRALFEDAARWDAFASRVENVALNEDPDFMDIYADEMRFPA